MRRCYAFKALGNAPAPCQLDEKKLGPRAGGITREMSRFDPAERWQTIEAPWRWQ
ncbi:hypothetical protein WKW80_33355 [Variovorax humicola]|uniref:Uncharacterized protein n=1 Tax=Variovorax humicola TaxID=1769758 RepID=A0ABU8W9X4_9BURK